MNDGHSFVKVVFFVDLFQCPLSGSTVCRCQHFILILNSLCSTNTTNQGTPDVISANNAKTIVDKAPPPGPPNPIDPIGWFYSHVLLLYKLLYLYMQWINGTMCARVTVWKLSIFSFSKQKDTL